MDEKARKEKERKMRQLRFKLFRMRVFEVIEVARSADSLSHWYDVGMMLTIILSLLPLAFKNHYPVFDIIDRVTVMIFIVDYLLRILTADFKLRKGVESFIVYPFTAMAIIDLISILPSVATVSNGLRLLKIFRLLRTLRVLHLLKAFRYSKSIGIFVKIFKRKKDELYVVFGIALIYILISALIILNVEPDTFGNYFDAVYWAAVSLTTVGYGDIYPVSTFGRVVTIISSFVGIAIVALPAGIVTSALMEALHGEDEEDEEVEAERAWEEQKEEVLYGKKTGEVQ